MLTFVIILVVVVAAFFALTYNSLTKDKNRIELAEVLHAVYIHALILVDAGQSQRGSIIRHPCCRVSGHGDSLLEGRRVFG